jgi:hypothetical protein
MIAFLQYCLNRRRCQLTTVAGCTTTSAVRHLLQSFIRAIQNSRSRFRSFGRGCSLLRIVNCWRKATFFNAISLWPASMRMTNRKVLRIALSMTRYLGLNVTENQSGTFYYDFWQWTGLKWIFSLRQLQAVRPNGENKSG